MADRRAPCGLFRRHRSRLFGPGTRWALSAATLRNGYLGSHNHLRAWSVLVTARGGRMDAPRVRLEEWDRARRLDAARATCLHHSRHAHADDQRAAAAAALGDLDREGRAP